MAKVCWACENPFPCAEHGDTPPIGYDFGGGRPTTPPLMALEAAKKRVAQFRAWMDTNARIPVGGAPDFSLLQKVKDFQVTFWAEFAEAYAAERGQGLEAYRELARVPFVDPFDGETVGGEETSCPKRDDGAHCEHWYDGHRPCCACGDLGEEDFATLNEHLDIVIGELNRLRDGLARIGRVPEESVTRGNSRNERGE